MTELIEVGRIVNTHGIKGEIRVMNISDFPDERYAKGNVLYIEQGSDEEIEVIVNSHRVHKNFHLLTFEGYTNINEVLHFVNHDLFIAMDENDDLGEDTFYFHDIVGLTVVDEEGEHIGEISEIMETGSNDVWIVKRQGKKDLLLPVIDSVILSVDLDEEVVVVHVLEGLDPDAN